MVHMPPHGGYAEYVECVGSLYGDDCMILSLSPTTRFGGETHLKATKMTRMAIIGGRGKNYRGTWKKLSEGVEKIIRGRGKNYH